MYISYGTDTPKYANCSIYLSTVQSVELCVLQLYNMRIMTISIVQSVCNVYIDYAIYLCLFCHT